jgi:peptide/nickel transport system substrate-binding protein
VYQAEKAALAKVGIQVTPATDDSSTYYSTFIGSPKNVKQKGIGMALAGWGADFPRVQGYYQAITNGNAITDPGTSNYASLNDPTVNKILDNGLASGTDFTQLRDAVMASATYLPIYWGATLMYRNPRMTNVTCDNALAFGNYDFVNAGVS